MSYAFILNGDGVWGKKEQTRKQYTGSDPRGSAGCIWGAMMARFSVGCVEAEGWEILRRQPHWRESAGGFGVCQARQARTAHRDHQWVF